MIHINFYYSEEDGFDCNLKANELHSFMLSPNGYFYNTKGPLTQQEFVNLISPVHSLISSEIQDLNNKQEPLLCPLCDSSSIGSGPTMGNRKFNHQCNECGYSWD